MSQNFGAQMGGRAKLVLLLLGVFFIVMGVAMQVGLGSLPFAGGAMTGTAVMFIVLGVVMIGIGMVVGRSAAATNRVATAGVPGTARILGLSQTGMSLNDQPQIGMDLEVSVPGMAAYRTTHKEFVPFLFLSRLQPGGMIAVRVDPANPQKLVVAWNEAPGMAQAGYAASMQGTVPDVGGAGVRGAGAPDESLGQVAAALQAAGVGGVAPVFAQADQANYSVEQLRQWLRANGIPGTARIDLLTDSGQTVGDERLMTMQTTLETPGRPPFQTAVSAAMVPVSKVGRLAVGVTLPVLIAPDNPNMTMFEWDKI